MTKTKHTASSSLKHSSVEEDGCYLATLRNARSIQDQVEDRLRQLYGVDKKGTDPDPKFKSQRGVSVDIYVKERVKWPHEFVLAGIIKGRITYNQLNIRQWMTGFCRIMKEETCQITKDHMLDYLMSLLDDSNDFSWQAAKASHAVLLCRMEQGEVTSWSQTDKSDWFRQANAQRHITPTQTSSGSQKFRKNQVPQFIYLGFYATFNTVQVILRRVVGRAEETSTYSSSGLCTVNFFPKIMRLRGYFIAIFAAHVLHRMVRLVLTVPWNVNKDGQKTNNPGHGQYI